MDWKQGVLGTPIVTVKDAYRNKFLVPTVEDACPYTREVFAYPMIGIETLCFGRFACPYSDSDHKNVTAY